MVEFRNCSKHIQTIIRMANEIAEKYKFENTDELIEAAHEIRSKSLHGEMPPTFLMQDLSNLLKDNNIDFAVIGAIALSVHGQVRGTDDIDVLVSDIPSRMPDADYMRKFNFYRSKSSTGAGAVIDHRTNGMVELLLANNPLRQWSIDTATKIMVLGVEVPVVSPAALIGLKIQAMVNNPKRASKDAPDILSVWIKSTPDLSEIKQFLNAKELVALESIIA
jgi:hypothetical protein